MPDCNKCSKKYDDCLCRDNPLETLPDYITEPEGCENPEPCSEVFDAMCICYTGETLDCPGVVTINPEDRLETILYNLALAICNMSDFAISALDEGVLIDPNITSLNFVGAAIEATTDGSGNITITVTSGIDGQDGADGADGADGLDAEVNILATNTLPPGSNAQVTDSNPDPRIADLTFDIPQGADGADGPPGPAGPPGPGLDLDFDTPDATLILDTSNTVLLPSTWVNPQYYPGQTEYGQLLYWDVSPSLCYVSIFFIMEVDRIKGGTVALTWNKRIVTPQSLIQFTGLPFTPKIGTPVGVGNNYNINAAAHYYGFLNDIDYPQASAGFESHETIAFRGTGSNEIITTQMSSGIGYHAPALKDATLHIQFQGYMFKQ